MRRYVSSNNLSIGQKIGMDIMRRAKQDFRNSVYEATGQWNKRYHDHF